MSEVLTPRPYQLEGSAWLRDKQRAFLTDQFGLGKTAQAIWAAVTPAIVFCPGYLMPRWAREIGRVLPGARVVVGSAPRVEDRQAQLNARVGDFYVCNIELLRTLPHTWFQGLRPLTGAAGEIDGYVRTMIVDEAHRLRGHKSKQHAGAYEVARRVERVYLLTATPVYNQPNDLYGQLVLLDSKRFRGYYKFLDDYLSVYHTPWGPKVVGLRKDKKLKDVFAEYALGRTRDDVAAQLPDLQETLVEVPGSKDFYELYRHTRRSYRDKFERMLLSQQSVLVALRQLTQDIKLQAVVQLVVDSGARDTLIYTYHRDLARAIGLLLKIPVVTGDTPADKRESVIQGSDMAVATFPSVAEGGDFSHMRNVIYAEQDWMPGLMEQSLARVQRPTNMHPTTNVYHVVVKNTVDTVIYRAFKMRGKPMQEIIEAALAEWDDEG